MRKYMKVAFAMCFYSLLFVTAVKAAVKPVLTDNTLTAEIQKQLNNKLQGLNYPKSVSRFYTRNNFRPVWIKPQNGTGQTWQGMLMLDCVMAFGLSHDDYHPKELTYDLLHDILDTPGKVKLNQQARYDILLTDAVITLMNHLYYGKLNPDYTQGIIDDGLNGKFHADIYLVDALTQKDLMVAIANVQPKVKLYVDLQHRMQLLKGKYQDDCYEVPEAEVRKIAINMERLCWAAIDEDNYLLINIPTYTLTFQQPDTAYQFKVAIGKPETPTPVLQSAVDYFTSAPDAKVIQKIFLKELLPNAQKDANYLKNNHYAVYDSNGRFILTTPEAIDKITKNANEYYARHSAGRDIAHGNLVFHFNNSFQVYLHDMPQKSFFEKQDRAFSNGCIWLHDAQKLGELLLKNESVLSNITALKKAMAKRERKTFMLKKAMPIHISYITCGVDDYGMVAYNDIYNLDQGLEMALYNVADPLSMR